MTSVERIQQYANLEQEAAQHTDVVPDNNWPSKGAIELQNVCISYDGSDSPALGPVTLDIKPAEKVLG